MHPIDLNNINDYPKFYFGGFWRRAGAGFIDLIALFTGLFIVIFLVSMLFTQPQTIENPYHANIFGQIIGAIISAVYYIAFVKIKSATPGKMMCKLKVVKLNQSPITWMDSFLRYAPYLVLASLMIAAQIALNMSFMRTVEIINMLWAIGAVICLLCHRQRRTLHDLIAKTAVIKV